jgi:hypothetical protein
MIGKRFSKPRRQAVQTDDRLQNVLMPYTSVFQSPIDIKRGQWTSVLGTKEVESVGLLPLAGSERMAPYRIVITLAQFRFAYDDGPAPVDEASLEARVPAIITFVNDSGGSNNNSDDDDSIDDTDKAGDVDIEHTGFAGSSVVILGALVAGLSILLTTKPKALFR